MAIEFNGYMLACLLHLINRTGRLVNTGLDRLRLLVVRFGITSLPADLLINCDDIVLALLALRVGG